MKFDFMKDRIKINRIAGIVCVITIQLIILLNGILLWNRPLYFRSFQGKEFHTEGGIFLEEFLGGLQNGFYFDTSMIPEGTENEEEILSLSTPATDLPKGSYRVTIHYQSEENRNTYTASSRYNTKGVRIGHVKQGIAGKDGKYSFQFESFLDIDDYEIKVDFCNSNYLFINQIDIEELPTWKVKVIISELIALFIFNIIYLNFVIKKKKIKKETITMIVLLVMVSFFTSLPAFYYGIFLGHDTDFHLARIEGLAEALKAGNFPVRMQNFFFNGYGYPVSIFYGDLFLYFPALLRIIGYSVKACYSILVFVINLSTCSITYHVSKKMMGNRWYGFFAAFLYGVMPYRLSCFYLRGAIGEVTAMIFYPLVIYGLYKIYEADTSEKENRGWVYLSFGFVGLIYSHLISTLMMGLITLVICLIFLKKTFSKKYFVSLLKSVTLAFLLSLQFLIPLLDYLGEDISLHYVENGGRFQGHGVYLNQLFNLIPHGTGRANSMVNQITVDYGMEMSYSIGIGSIVVIIIFILYRINFSDIKDYRRKWENIFFAVGITCIFMVSIYFPWEFIEQSSRLFAKLIETIQFPWRFLGIVSLMFSFLGAYILANLKEGKKIELSHSYAIVIILGSLITSGYWMSDFMNSHNPSLIRYHNEVNSYAVGQGEYVVYGADIAAFHDQNLSYGEEVEVFEIKRTHDSMIIQCKNSSNTEQVIDVPFMYYKSYRAKDENREEALKVISGEGKRVGVIIPEGYDGVFEVKFESPFYWRICEFVSLISFIVFVFRRKIKIQQGERV